jgi:hypothetical protein
MNDWAEGNCFLCGSKALVYQFVDSSLHPAMQSRGEKYNNCQGGCPPYAIPGDILDGLQLLLKDNKLNADGLKKISELLKEQKSAPNIFFVLTDNIVEQATGRKMLRWKT